MSLMLNHISFKPTEEYHLNDINLRFDSGKMYTILGRTLSGKTTLLKTISGLQTHDSGSINFEDTDFLSIPVVDNFLILQLLFYQLLNRSH